MLKVTYPVILKKGTTCAYTARFYDIEAMTQGDSLEETVNMAKKVLELCIERLIEDKEEIPNPTNPENIELGQGEFIIFIDVNISLIRNEVNTKSIKKTLTIPYWLNEAAEKNNVNFSQLLQVAIKEHLNIN